MIKKLLIVLSNLFKACSILSALSVVIMMYIGYAFAIYSFWITMPCLMALLMTALFTVMLGLVSYLLGSFCIEVLIPITEKQE